MAGKEIMLKSILQAILTYATGIFLLPKAITSRLNALFKKYWWGSHGDRTKIQWLNWSSMGLPKYFGGLGLRDMASFNVALLSK